MIGWLSGIVRHRDPLTGIVILDVGGVGYELTVSWQTFADVPEADQPCALWVHTHVREDVLALFGFSSREEKRMFQLLTGVPQVGPKLAISVLGGFPLPELLQAIADGERALLERIPGVGKRTAERILLDLKEKVRLLMATLPSPTTDEAPAVPAARSPVRDEALAALVGLGWKQKAVEAALDKALAEDPSIETLDGLVRRGLALLMGR